MHRFHHFVEAAGVAEGFATEQRTFGQAGSFFAGNCPRAIATNGIELAIVGDEAKGLGFVPSAIGIGTEAAMKKPKACLISRIL